MSAPLPYAAAPQMSTAPQMPTGPIVATVLPKIMQSSYAHEVPFPSSEHFLYEFMMNCIGNTLGVFGSVPCCFCCPNPYVTVQQGRVGLLTRFGKYYRSVDPGLYFVNVVSENMASVDIKLQVEDIPRQAIMTRDNVALFLDSVLYWRVMDPYVSTYLVSDVKKALIDRTQTTLRQILGIRTVQDAVEHRDSIAHEIQAIIAPAAESWGVKIESILIKDLQFSPELQDALSMAAKQKRIGEATVIAARAEGESKVITAQAEVQAARLMREAADILNTPAAMQIRYLETLQKMAATGQTKVIFMPSADSGDSRRMGAKDAATYDYMATQ